MRRSKSKPQSNSRSKSLTTNMAAEGDKAAHAFPPSSSSSSQFWPRGTSDGYVDENGHDHDNAGKAFRGGMRWLPAPSNELPVTARKGRPKKTWNAHAAGAPAVSYRSSERLRRGGELQRSAAFLPQESFMKSEIEDEENPSIVRGAGFLLQQQVEILERRGLRTDDQGHFRRPSTALLISACMRRESLELAKM